MKSLSSKKQPHIVFILADDLGCCDLGFYGNLDVKTPELDRLSKESLKHEAFYVNPICAPSRASFLTGRHHLKTGVSQVHGGHECIHLDETLIAEALSKVGYKTGMWGKWHNGVANGYLPHQRGFDEAKRTRLYKHRNPIIIDPEHEQPIVFQNRWADDVLVDQCLNFFHQHQDQPVFAYIASMSPHGPLDGPDNLVENYLNDGLSIRLAKHYALIEQLDSSIGKLRRSLTNLNDGRDVIIVFASDNGPAMHENQFTNEDRERRNVLKWRGWKGDVWEAGIRSPLLIHCPNRFTARTEHQLADITDLFPTFCHWAGLTPKELNIDFDGRDITPMLVGKKMTSKKIFSWTPQAVPPCERPGDWRIRLDELRPYQKLDGLPLNEQVISIRDGNYKLCLNANINENRVTVGEEHLFQLADDPCEKSPLNPIYENNIQSRNDLYLLLKEWWQEILSENHSFVRPIIKLDSKVTFNANMCQTLSKHLTNGIDGVQHFGNPKDQISWLISLDSPKSFYFQLDWKIKPTSRIRFKLFNGDAVSYGSNDENGNLYWEEPIHIDAGVSELVLEITESNMQKNTAHQARLFQIHATEVKF